MRQGLTLTGPAKKLTPADTIKRLWEWRDFIWTLTAREIRGRYVGSIGGVAWNIIQPLVLIAVFTILFSSILHIAPFGGGSGYLIYLVAALLPWNAFQEAVQKSSNVFIEYSTLVQKLAFPLESMVAQTIAASTLNLVISLFILLLFLPVLGVKYSVTLLLLPCAILLQVLLTAGLSLAVAALTPFWRDVPPFTGLALFLGFWLTPIVYTPELIPAELSWWFRLNPLHHLVRLYRAAWTGAGFPSINEIAGSAAAGAVILVIGWIIFARVHREIPEML
jgi:ABC-type polysaccharide/polyol phosphate export permease